VRRSSSLLATSPVTTALSVNTTRPVLRSRRPHSRNVPKPLVGVGWHQCTARHRSCPPQRAAAQRNRRGRRQPDRKAHARRHESGHAQCQRSRDLCRRSDIQCAAQEPVKVPQNRSRHRGHGCSCQFLEVQQFQPARLRCANPVARYPRQRLRASTPWRHRCRKKYILQSKIGARFALSRHGKLSYSRLP